MSLLPEFFSDWVYLGPLFAGALSITHCSVMCGPLVVMFKDHSVSYHIGRILGYTAVGALLGAIGVSLDRAGDLLALQNVSIYISALLLIVYGLSRLLPAKIWHKIPTPAFFYLPARLMSRLKKQDFLPESLAIFLAGILSALIPCAILYPLWAVAAGSGSIVTGAGFAFAFVLGTIPGLAFIQWTARRASGGIRRFLGQKLRIVSVVLMIFTGVFIIVWREGHAPRMDFREGASQDANCLPGESTDKPQNIDPTIIEK